MTVLVAQTTFRPGSGRSAPAWARGPTADGQAAKPARRRAPLGPKLALSPPRRPSPSDLNPTAARARRANKTGDGRRSPNPRVHSLPPPFLSRTAAAMGGRGRTTVLPWTPSPAGAFALVRVRRSQAVLQRCLSPHAHTSGVPTVAASSVPRAGKRRHRSEPHKSGGSGAQTRQVWRPLFL